MSCVITMPEFNIRLCGPTSTSKQKEVATRFGGTKGIIMQLNNKSDARSKYLRAFRCAWLSTFSGEDEYLFIGGDMRLKIDTIIHIETANNLAGLFHALFYFDCMLNGTAFSADTKPRIKESKRKIVQNLIKHQLKGNEYQNDYDEKDELNYNILCKYKGNEWKADCIEYAMKTCNINFLNHICKHIRFKMHHSDKFAKYIFDIFPHHYNYRHININFAQYILSNEFLKMINVNENEFDEVRFDLLTHTKPDWEEGESAFMQMVRNDSNEKNIKLIKMTLNLIKSDEKKMKLIHYVYKNNNQNEDDNNMDEYYRYNEYDNNQVEYDIFTFYDSKKKNIEAIQNIEADLTTDLLKNKVE
eukprot:66940_1